MLKNHAFSMDSIKDKYCTVITGDIIGSKRLPQDARQALFKHMKEGSSAVRRYFDDFVPLDIAVARGDEWQMLVSRPAEALRVGLYYRAYLKASMTEVSVDTRFAIGIGSINFIPGSNVAEGDGEAFNLSGKTLDGLNRFSIGVAAAEDPKGLFSKALESAALLVDSQAKGWTSAQAQAVCGTLLGWTQNEIAARWPGERITQQAVSQHLKSAEWVYVEYGLGVFKQLVENRPADPW